ncbi:hypothetical protein JQN72_04300 [Phycicoccus sp. CSK15P-2]|uniref:hypothetical protein n=1 Tax=Phycicoccus sp. CSK15P-2 TaxID=2807627 RepID=UPI00194DEC6D|nr:hypothetical protein [Phycicoccus sp. CSK15P-2]MBM6403463.1 hypothetical protein [Phycicoccus sp. CSK15P-2]
MGDTSFTVDLGAVRGVATDITTTSESAGEIDVATPLSAVAAALPRSETAGRVPDASFELGAAVAVWAGRVAGAAEDVTASADQYAEDDARSAARVQRLGGPTP